VSVTKFLVVKHPELIFTLHIVSKCAAYFFQIFVTEKKFSFEL